jgi:hypothetical protein
MAVRAEVASHLGVVAGEGRPSLLLVDEPKGRAEEEEERASHPGAAGVPRGRSWR